MYLVHDDLVPPPRGAKPLTKRHRRDSNHPQVRALFDAARQLELDSPRKHHLVPEFYLRRWANEDDRIRVTEVEDHHSYVTNVNKAARETDFYNLRDKKVSPADLPPLLPEALLGVAEGWGQEWITSALALPPGMMPQLELDPQMTASSVGTWR